MRYKKLNLDWNAEPNAPEVKLETNGNQLRVEFYLNPFIFDHINDYDKGELKFIGCHKYSFNSCNDEGYFRDQYRYHNDVLPWGEFYELEHVWEDDFHPDYKILNENINKKELKHYIFFFKDNTLECIAKGFEFNYL